MTLVTISMIVTPNMIPIVAITVKNDTRPEGKSCLSAR